MLNQVVFENSIQYSCFSKVVANMNYGFKSVVIPVVHVQSPIVRQSRSKRFLVSCRAFIKVSRAARKFHYLHT